jgi:hypothetical protein
MAHATSLLAPRCVASGLLTQAYEQWRAELDEAARNAGCADDASLRIVPVETNHFWAGRGALRRLHELL